jgi:hypothetical protein
LLAANDAHDVVVKHATGNIVLANNADFNLNTASKWLLLRRDSSLWIEVDRGFGPDLSAFRSYLQLGALAVLNTVGAAQIDSGAVTPIKLQNGVASPGNEKYYGTNASGAPGFHAFPAFSSAPVIRIYNAPGSYTWTKPANIKRVRVIVLGSTSSDSGFGSGGSGGGWAIKVIEAASLGASESVNVGTGGAQSTPSGHGNNSTGVSSFGTHCQATGGRGGFLGQNLTGGTAQLTVGVGSGGDLNGQGEMGFPGTFGGGRSEQYGRGGGSLYGPGGQSSATSAPGSPGLAPGSGGAGGVVVGGFNTQPGGKGSDGLVIVEEFY